MATPSTTTLIDVIVLVFAKSELRTLVGTDALRTVLEGEQRALFPELDTMVLQPVYELLESQPGFDPEKAVAPFCRLKTWEQRIGIKIVMPTPLEVLDTKTCELKAMNVSAFDSDLDKLLNPPTPAVQAAPLARVIESGNVRAGAGSATSSRVKIAMIVAMIAVAAAGISIYLTLNATSSTTVKLTATELSSEIPLAHVRKSGDVIIATVTDPAWIKKPEFDRRKQLEAVAVKMRIHQVKMLMLADPQGVTIASVLLKGTPIITFIARKPT
jgi:hypothetical protein